MKQKIESITIGIAVKDVHEAKLWYKTLLDVEEVMEPAPGVIELKLTDNAWLQLDDSGYLKAGEGSIVRFQTNEIDAMYSLAKRLANDIENIETVPGVIKYFDFKDPAGNRLSYYQLL